MKNKKCAAILADIIENRDEYKNAITAADDYLESLDSVKRLPALTNAANEEIDQNGAKHTALVSVSASAALLQSRKTDFSNALKKLNDFCIAKYYSVFRDDEKPLNTMYECETITLFKLDKSEKRDWSLKQYEIDTTVRELNCKNEIFTKRADCFKILDVLAVILANYRRKTLYGDCTANIRTIDSLKGNQQAIYNDVFGGKMPTSAGKLDAMIQIAFDSFMFAPYADNPSKNSLVIKTSERNMLLSLFDSNGNGIEIHAADGNSVLDLIEKIARAKCLNGLKYVQKGGKTDSNTDSKTDGKTDNDGKTDSKNDGNELPQLNEIPLSELKTA